MHRLNYHHLLYFYTVAHEGSVARASARLGLKQPTISAQIHELEKKLGRQLLERSGRGLRVTAAGRMVLRYAESIFSLGDELLATIDGQPTESAKLNIGVNSLLPAALLTPLLQPLLALKPMPALTIIEGTSETLVSQLSSQSMQFALDDCPPPSSSRLRSRILLQSPVAVFAPAALATTLRKSFPKRLAEVQLLMPSSPALRREAENWLATHKQPINKLAELPHPESLAAATNAATLAPMLLRDALKKSHALVPVADLPGSHWRLYVITESGNFRHPAVAAISHAAKALH